MEIEKTSSKLAVVSGGEIEYAIRGKGPAILISHGSLGGFDQSLAVTRLFKQSPYSFLVPSRAGYLRSSPQTGLTPEKQALSFLELLDHVGIDSAAIIGLSGGAPSAIRFAQNYPDRCWALVLISSIATTPSALPPFFQLAIRLQDTMMRIDPLWAIVYKYGLGLLVRSNGVSADQSTRIFEDPHLLSVVRGIYQPILTSSSRRQGLRLDDEHIQLLPDVGSYEIRVPTHISHAVNDPLASSANAAKLAASIPGAEYHEYPDGGHIFFVVHSAQVISSIEQFLMTNAPE